MDSARIAAIPLFSGLSDDALDAVARAAGQLHVVAGDKVTTKGDLGHSLFFIEAGTARVEANGATVETLGVGEFFGEMAVLSTGRRTADVVAETDLDLLSLFKKKVWDLEEQIPGLTDKLRAEIEARRAST